MIFHGANEYYGTFEKLSVDAKDIHLKAKTVRLIALPWAITGILRSIQLEIYTNLQSTWPDTDMHNSLKQNLKS